MMLRAVKFVAVLLIVALQGPPALAADGSGGKWYSNYEQGRRAAAERDLPLLLHFYADWCGPCRKMDAGVLGTADVLRQLNHTVIGVKINIERESPVAERFDISGFPADVVVSPAGKVLASWNGYASTPEYLERLRQAAHGQDMPVPPPEVQPVAVTRQAAEPSLKGYCPVSIARDRVWRKGQDRFVHTHRGCIYRFHSAAELRRFRADPARFAPRLRGCDPVALADRHQRTTGSVQYTAIYRDGLYLFSSAANQQAFCQSPQYYADAAEWVSSVYP